MKIFISWSGAKSRVVAEALRQELPTLIQEADIFVSSEDIDKGSAWFPSIAKELEDSAFGIICLTPDNLNSSWIHFEAGALAAKFSQAKVAPLLIELENAQVPPPLSQLQLTRFKSDDFFKLINSINKHLKKPLQETALKKCFERCWPELEKRVVKLLKEQATLSPAPKRDDREILEEILAIVRLFSNGEFWPSLMDPATGLPVGYTLPDSHSDGGGNLHFLSNMPAEIANTLRGPLDH